MIRLILDHIIRWWWVLGLMYLAAILSTIGGVPFLVAPVGVILLFLDAQAGLIRATAPLPISLATQARARWLFAVPFIVSTGAVALVLGAVLRDTVFSQFSDAWGPEVAAGVIFQTCLGFCSAGLTFIGLSFAENRPPETWREYLTQLFVGLCWGLSFASLGWLGPWFLRHNYLSGPWPLYSLAVAVPALVGFSYLSSERFIRRRSLPANRNTSPATRRQKSETKGASGIPLYLLSIPGRVIVFTLAMTSIQWVTIRFVSGHWTSYTNVGLLQFALFGMFISTFVTEQVSVRALRTLPLSTRQLTLLLLSGPCLSALGIVLLWIPETLQKGLTLASVGRMTGMILLAAGGGALCLAVVLRYVGLGRVGVIFALAVAAPFAIFFLPEIPGAAAAFGVITGISGYFLLHRSLQRSSVTYQPRKLFGLGMSQAQ
ncbi:MAG: hypothetical protein EOP84_15980 [Verrucomicrobiaceae bacterium]|nr:MAG: hypothetical protein EOP84_15980 [Verrucomicrobiaceae bacterium]